MEEKSNRKGVLERVITWIKPRKSLSQLPKEVAMQFWLLCAGCFAMALISALYAFGSRSVKPLYGILTACILYLFVLWNHFWTFFYDNQMILEGIVISIPADGEDESLTEHIVKDYKRLILVIQADDGMFYKVPCSRIMLRLQKGDRVRVFCENGGLRQLSDTSYRTPTASLIEMIEERMEDVSAE